jgi:hypothetical protein
VILSDEEMATGSIAILAAQKQAAMDEQKAKGKSEPELKSAIISGLEEGVAHGLDRRLSIQTSMYLIEFSRRGLHDATINKLRLSLEQKNKLGACWGIPPETCNDAARRILPWHGPC